MSARERRVRVLFLASRPRDLACKRLDHGSDKTSRFAKMAAAQLFWMLSQPVNVFLYTPLDVVLRSVAHVFLDPGDFHVRIRPEWEKRRNSSFLLRNKHRPTRMTVTYFSSRTD